jgi:hypothetical protein
MYFVKPIIVGEDGLGCIDPDRRDRLPAKTWRPVPRNPYWLRLNAMGDVQLLTERPPEEEIEGYVASPVAEPAAMSAAAPVASTAAVPAAEAVSDTSAKPAKKGSDA